MGTAGPAPAALDYRVPELPESGTGYQVKPGWATQRFAVAAANPLATDAGYQVLRAGGSALDAAVAVQMVLALVEPQSSGIGGGAFLLSWDGRALAAWDGRETAPAGADENLFMQPDGKAMPMMRAMVGGRAVGTPGVLRMLELAHREQGADQPHLPWGQLFEPAIRLAEQGFRISPRLHGLLSSERALKLDPQAGPLYYQANGEPLPVGHLLKNPALAEVLRAVAREGAAAFYGGAVAADMVRRVRGHASNPGKLSLADLQSYQPKKREALCSPWAARPERSLRVCGFPPPSSGHLTVMQILGLLEQTPEAGPAFSAEQGQVMPSADWLHRYLEASRLAFADRDLFIADPDFVAPPGGAWASLLAPAYLKQRAALIGSRSMGPAQAGNPGGERSAYAPQAAQPEYGTSHISIIDGQGRAVAMTTTVEAVFGSRLMSDGGTGKAGGFLLNNQLTDFSLAPTDGQGRAVANRLQPGKRPRSSMSPTLVFDAGSGQLLMSLGSPGGPAIIHFVAKTLIGTQQWALDAQAAISLPNFGNFNSPSLLEQGRFPAATAQALRARGHQVIETELTSGLQAIERRPGGWFGGADPRREGVVRGD
ncbi:MAG: gamma-glutamyltransferase family protein [Burkholderiaceae bacterium]|nr:gamma-glutamyltransferase family protein [Burkholderiaceae bacterium]